jgi:hypothetical protein
MQTLGALEKRLELDTPEVLTYFTKRETGV